MEFSNKFIHNKILESYAAAFRVNLQECKPLSEYKSLADFFSRKLIQDRPVDWWASMTSPVDGKVLQCSALTEDNSRVEQVKGMSYSLSSLLGQERDGEAATAQEQNNFTLKNPKNALYSMTVYLAPGDYHRFHSPAEMNIQTLRHYSGELLSVSPWIASMIKGLFVLNERVALIGQWKYGSMAVIPVGATNVGSIHISVADRFDVFTNKEWILSPGIYKERKMEKIVKKGEELGYFELGSTVVLVFEAPKDFKFTVKPGDRLLQGQRISNY